jgi:hypothetical protein
MRTLLPIFRRLGATAAVLLLALAPGCGDDAPPAGQPTRPPDGSPWSEVADPTATGSPDGDMAAGGVKSADAVLERLRARVASGEGSSDQGYQREAEAVAAVLWPGEPEGEDLASARVHMDVATIAGDVSRWLVESEDARALREKSHGLDVEVHDAFLAASAKGPEAYKAWCAGEGQALVARRKAALYEKLFDKK